MIIENPTVIVMVSQEVVDELQDWSEPVRLKIVERPDMIPAHEMLVSQFRVEVCPYDCGHTDCPVHGPEDEAWSRTEGDHRSHYDASDSRCVPVPDPTTGEPLHSYECEHRNEVATQVKITKEMLAAMDPAVGDRETRLRAAFHAAGFEVVE